MAHIEVNPIPGGPDLPSGNNKSPFKPYQTMLTETIEPIISISAGKKIATGAIIRYRFAGILVYKKTLHLPSHYGLTEWEFIHRF